ncbi:hypothetical protein, partial [Streptomyces galbus]|uniref:hypothetical protein n=1 Tax=Streptomyces galbus TaxID=33898 RepID=UPI001B33F659
MPDEAQHLTAAKPESASAPTANPAAHAQNDTRGPVEHDRTAPADRPAEAARPKPVPYTHRRPPTNDPAEVSEGAGSLTKKTK